MEFQARDFYYVHTLNANDTKEKKRESSRICKSVPKINSLFYSRGETDKIKLESQ